MKTKLLSVFLVLAMLLTSVLCLLPAAAETDYDAEAKTKGYVCRVGTAEEAAKNEYAGYYKTTKEALDAAFSGKTNTTATITLINDVSGVGETVTMTSGNTLILDGRKSDTENFSYTSKGGFLTNGGKITVKNLNVTVTGGAKQAIGGARTSTLTFENCKLSTDSTYDRTDDGLFFFTGDSKTTLNMTNCVISVDAKGQWGKSGEPAVFKSFKQEADITVNLNNVRMDVTNLSNANIKGFDLNGASQLNITGGSKIKIPGNGIINIKNVSIKDSTVESTNVYALYIINRAYAVNITLEGDAVVNGAKRALNVINNTNAVSLTAKGNSEIRSAAGEGNAIYVCGHDDNASFTLTMMDNSKLLSSGNVISFANGGNPIKKATICFLDRVTIQAEKGYLLDSHERPVTYILSDKATISVTDEEPIKNTTKGRLITSTVYAPVMKKGASIRTVEGSKGIRFTSTMKKVTDTDAVKLTATYGTLIVKAADLEGKEFTVDALTKAGVKFANIVATAAGTVAGETETTYNAALVNLPDDQLDTNFAARAYAVYTINGVEHYVYSDFNATDNCRSMSQIASKAQADTQPTKSADYPYEIAAGVYSPYTKSQYAVISEYVKKN